MLDKFRYIVVEGPIGAGKTSLTRRLAERLASDSVLEQPELNVFLSRFYQNAERWGLATQLSFLFQRIELLKDLALRLQAGQRVVSDFLIEKDPLFAKLNLSADEATLYEDIFNRLQVAAPKPDLVIYLQAPAETLMERVKKRNVDAERRITEGYLQSVAERYASFFHQYDGSPLFIVDAQVLNPVDVDADFELLYQRLAHMRSYREYFGYAE